MKSILKRLLANLLVGFNVSAAPAPSPKASGEGHELRGVWSGGLPNKAMPTVSAFGSSGASQWDSYGGRKGVGGGPLSLAPKTP